VIESLMIFALGFFVSTLLALLIIPALNERADRLARRRVEAQLPTSVAELNAERDSLRAELAVRERRMEIRLEEIRASQVNDRVELGHRAARIAALTDERDAARAEISRLETVEETLRAALADSEARAQGLSTNLLETRDILARREGALADLQGRHAKALADLDTQRIRVADLQTRLDSETARANEAERLARARREEIVGLEAELARTRKALADEEARGEVLERRAETFAAERDGARTDLAAREATLAETYGAKDELTDALARESDALAGANSRIADLEARASQLERDRSADAESHKQKQESLRRDIDGLRAEKASLQGALDQARNERRRLELELARQKKVFEDDLAAQNKLLLSQIDEVTQRILDTPHQDAGRVGAGTGNTNGANGRKAGAVPSAEKASPGKNSAAKSPAANAKAPAANAKSPAANAKSSAGKSNVGKPSAGMPSSAKKSASAHRGTPVNQTTQGTAQAAKTR
jgi:chromosome segregation ATPase